MSSYDRHLEECRRSAVQWERAAEAARSAGNLSLAYDCSQRAIRCWYLAVAEPQLDDIFSAQRRGKDQ